MKKIIFGVMLGTAIRTFAQDSADSLAITGYSETYYSCDFNKPADNNRPGFIYSHNRHNEFNINLAIIKAAYLSQKARANIALATGSYMNANYAAEPGVLRNIYEANGGLKIGRKDLWLDAGVFSSHIGFESAVSKDCWTLTRSILAENSPYFEAGAKLTYTSDGGKWLVSGLALNGWQRITRINGNSLMSWGTQIQFRPSDRVLLNYSTFTGTDKPDSTRLNRFFHNFYGIFNLSDKVGLITGFDIGSEQKSPDRNGHNVWYSPVVIIRYIINARWAMAARAEYYNDEQGVIIATGTPDGFKTKGFSLNIDHSPAKNIISRIEVRALKSKDKIFAKENGTTDNNCFITGSIAVSF